MTADEVPPPLRFSTDDLPPRDRLAIWREMIGRVMARLDLTPLGDGPYRSESVTHALPDLSVTSMSTTAIRSRRTPELIADGNDDILLILVDEGSGTVSQLSREVVVNASTAALVSNADASSVTMPTAKGHLLRMPRHVLLPLVGKLEDTFVRPMPRANEALHLLTGYVAMITQMPPLATPELRHLVATHMHDLVANAIGATRDAAVQAEGRGVAAARLRAIKSDIVKNLSNHEATIGWLARRHSVSPRYIQMMFETEGTTFSEFVLVARLDRVHRSLCDQRLTERPIGILAFEAGFSDLSYFNRAFRRRYGATPSDIKVAAARGDRK